MKCVVLDKETIDLIRNALVVAKRHNIRSAKTALIKLDGPSILERLTERMDSLSVTESDSWVHSDELNRLQMFRSNIESAQENAEDFLNIEKHINPGSYCIQLQRQMDALLQKGFTEFMLPDNSIMEKLEDMELAEIPIKHLRAARALLDWKRQALARRAGVDVSVIVDYELHDREPDAKARRAIINTMKTRGVRFSKAGVGLESDCIDDPQSLAYDLAHSPYNGLAK